MKFSEGQIFEGSISLSGENIGPTRRWIVISPFNKIYLCSIDEPLELHYLPIYAAEKGVERGYIELAETDIDHPLIRLQRDKEMCELRDIHLGLHGESLNKMFRLLEHAVKYNVSYAPYTAGEILTFIDCDYHCDESALRIKNQVYQTLQDGEF